MEDDQDDCGSTFEFPEVPIHTDNSTWEQDAAQFNRLPMHQQRFLTAIARFLERFTSDPTNKDRYTLTWDGTILKSCTQQCPGAHQCLTALGMLVTAEPATTQAMLRGIFTKPATSLTIPWKLREDIYPVYQWLLSRKPDEMMRQAVRACKYRNHAQADTLFRQVAAVYHARRNFYLEGVAWQCLGNMHNTAGHYKESLILLTKALNIFSKMSDYERLSDVHSHLFDTNQHMAQRDTACYHAKQSLDAAIKSKDEATICTAWGLLGFAHAMCDRFPQAENCYQEMKRLLKGLNDPGQEAEYYYKSGTLFVSQKKYSQAIENLRNAVVLYRQLGHRGGEGVVHGQLARAFQGLGKIQEALLAAEKYYEINAELGILANMTVGSALLGEYHGLLKQHPKAIEAWKRSLEEATRMGDLLMQSSALRNLAIHYSAIGRTKDASWANKELLRVIKQLGQVDKTGMLHTR